MIISNALAPQFLGDASYCVRETKNNTDYPLLCDNRSVIIGNVQIVRLIRQYSITATGDRE